MGNKSKNAILNVVNSAKRKVSNIIDSINKRVSNISLSTSNGLLITGTVGCWSFNGQVGISTDTKGNIVAQGSYSGGITATSGTPSFSFALATYHSVTNAPDVEMLAGTGYQIGGSVAEMVGPVPVFIGGDLLLLEKPKATETPYIGISVASGVGIPGKELHVEWGNTRNITRTINIFDTARSWLS